MSDMHDASPGGDEFERWVLALSLGAESLSVLDELETGRCWICGELTIDQCDHGTTYGNIIIVKRPDGSYTYRNPPEVCGRWLCPEHATVVHQPWDIHWIDGVDIRCHEHLSPGWKGSTNA